ncbi:MAG TPA: hypothetical protein VKU85_16950, partial [bacterium]|nr:hypothetical protein [bacterium]
VNRVVLKEGDRRAYRQWWSQFVLLPSDQPGPSRRSGDRRLAVQVRVGVVLWTVEFPEVRVV